jgi:hypothetical protein
MKSATISATTSSKFKTASWQGVVRPDWSPATDLVTMTIRLPKELDDDVEVAVKKCAHWFESKEEFLVTAAAFAIQNLAEFPPPTRRPKRLPPHSSRRSSENRPRNT